MQTLAQNIPETLRYSLKVDSDLPEGTIELRDESGRVLGRIENIGKDPSPCRPTDRINRLTALLQQSVVDHPSECHCEVCREVFIHNPPAQVDTCHW